MKKISIFHQVFKIEQILKKTLKLLILIYLMQKSVNKYIPLLLITIACIIGIAASIWSYSNNYITVYADGVSHLNIARRVVDNLQPGIVQIGGSWLPLYHIVLIPFVQSDFLWHSGLAGTFVSVLSFITASIFLHLIINMVTKSKLFALLGSIAFLLTPDIFYMATTPMTEVFTVALLLGASFFLLKWIYEDNGEYLIVSSFFAFAGILTRYEVWFYAVISVIIVSLIAFRKHKNLGDVEGTTILYGFPLILAFLVWFGWNTLIFHDPFYFMHGNFSARAYQIPLEQSGQLPTKGNIVNAAYYYFQALLFTNGELYVWFAILGFLLFYILNFKKYKYWVLIALIGPILFEIISLNSGSTALWLPNLFPFKMYNIRYGIYGSIFTFVFLPLLFYRLKRFGILLFVCTIFIQLWFFSHMGLPITLRDALIGRTDYNGKSILEGAAYIKDNYKSGLILAPAGALDPLIFSSGLPNRTFITEGAKKYWDASLKNPDKYASWIVMTDVGNGVNIHDGIQEAVSKNKKLLKNYNKVYDKGAVIIYRRKDR